MCKGYLEHNALPGNIDDWIASTDKPDFGYSGLRDIGDLEMYGRILSFGQPGLTTRYLQKGAMMNTLANNLFAIMLIYARLHRSDIEFHYQNPQAVEDVSRFLEQTCEQLLTGLFTKNKSLKNYFDNESEYKEWRRITARELMYWSRDRDDFSACGDLKRVRALSPELYDISSEIDEKLCLNSLGMLGLSYREPQVHLIEGLTLLCEKVALELY